MKKRLLSTSVLCAVSMIFVSGSAISGGHSKKASDTKKGDGYESVGARAGSFKIDPKLTIKQIFDDNFYKEKSGASSKDYTVINPAVTIRSDWNQNELRINGSVERDQFSGSSADNATESDLRLRFRLDASKSAKLKFEGRQRNLIEERGDDNTSTDDLGPTEYKRNNWGVSYEYKPNRFGINLGVRYDDYDYEDTAKEGGGTTNNDDRDRKETKYEWRLGYEIQKGYEAFIRGEVIDVDYDAASDDNSEKRDSDGYIAEAGIKVELTKLFDADLAIGQIKRDFAESTFSSISETSANAKVTWHASPLTKIRVSASRDLNEATTSGTSGNLATSFGVGIDHEFLRNMKGKIDYKVSTTDYEDSSNNRSDDKDKLDVSIDYELNRNFSVGAKYTFEERDSNVNTNDYDRNIFMLRVAGKF